MKDIELFALIPDGKDTWRIMNEDNIFIIDICDYDIEEICEHIYNGNYIEKYSAKEFITSVWEFLRDQVIPELNGCGFCENWDKFCAWFDYQAMKYFTTTLSNMYKQRLLDFE